MQQNAYTKFDFTCPLMKTMGMLRAIITFYRQAFSAIDNSSEDHKITLSAIKLHCAEVLQRVIDAKVRLLFPSYFIFIFVLFFVQKDGSAPGNSRKRHPKILCKVM